MKCLVCRRIFLGGFLFLFAFGLAGCEKKRAAEEPSAIDRVQPLDQASQSILHKTFTLRTTAEFPFEVPAHAALPHLHGNYKSYLTNLGVQMNEHSADVNFFVFDDQQYADFVAGTPGDAVFAADPSHDQAVDVSLPPSLNDTKKFHLVFRNTPGGDLSKTVQADLTVDF